MDTVSPRTVLSAARIARARAALSFDFAVLGVGVGMWAVYIPIVADRLGFDTGIVGIALFVAASAAILAMPFAGVVIARVGSRPPAIVGGGAFAAVLPLVMLAPQPTIFFLGVVLLGLTLGFFEVAVNSHGTEVEAALGKPAMSGFHAFFSVGGLAGSGISAAMVHAEVHEGAVPIALALAFAAAAAAAGFYLLPSAPREEGGPRFVFPSRPVWFLGLLAALAFALEGAVIDWSAMFLSIDKGASPAAAAAGVSFFMIAMAAFRFLGDAVVGRLGRRTTLIASGLIITGGTAIAILSPSVIGSAIGFGLVGIGAANIVPILFSASATVPGIPASVGVASVTTCGYGAFLVAPSVIGFIGRGYGLAVALSLIGVAGIAVALGGSRLRI